MCVKVAVLEFFSKANKIILNKIIKKNVGSTGEGRLVNAMMLFCFPKQPGCKGPLYLFFRLVGSGMAPNLVPCSSWFQHVGPLKHAV